MRGRPKGSCSVCRHRERARIEDLRASGVGLDALAEQFGLSKSALHRHWHQHTSAERKLTYLVGRGTLEQLRDRAQAESLTTLDSLTLMRSILMGSLVAQAEANEAVPLAAVSGKLLDVLREIGSLTGEVQRHTGPSVTVNVGLMAAPGFAELQDGLLRIARKHSDARADIIALLHGLGGSAPAVMAGPALIEAEALDA